MFDDVERCEYTAFKMFVTQMSNYLFVISFQLMFYKTLRYRLARPLKCLWNEIFFRKIMGKCVNMNAWYEKQAKIWIFNRKIKWPVSR